jgi:hypothetical protein
MAEEKPKKLFAEFVSKVGDKWFSEEAKPILEEVFLEGYRLGFCDGEVAATKKESQG